MALADAYTNAMVGFVASSRLTDPKVIVAREELESAIRSLVKPVASGEVVAWRFVWPDGECSDWKDGKPGAENSRVADEHDCTIEQVYSRPVEVPKGLVAKLRERMEAAIADGRYADSAAFAHTILILEQLEVG